MKRPIQSPCINVCVIDAGTGLCAGCGRSLDEIARWSAMTDEERRRIMRELARAGRLGRDSGGEVSMGAWIALLLLVIAGLALLLRADAGSIAGFDPSDFAIVVAGVALLIFMGSSLAGSYRGRAGQAVRDLLTWVLVAVVLVGGYSYREEIFGLGHRVAGELLPPGSALRGARRRSWASVGAHPQAARRPFHGQDGGQWHLAEHAGRYRGVHRRAEAGRRPAAGHRRRPAALHGARADSQRYHLCGAACACAT